MFQCSAAKATKRNLPSSSTAVRKEECCHNGEASMSGTARGSHIPSSEYHKNNSCTRLESEMDRDVTWFNIVMIFAWYAFILYLI